MNLLKWEASRCNLKILNVLQINYTAIWVNTRICRRHDRHDEPQSGWKPLDFLIIFGNIRYCLSFFNCTQRRAMCDICECSGREGALVANFKEI